MFIRLFTAVGLALVLCQAAFATPIPGSPNEIFNGDFSSGLDGWTYAAGDVVAAVVGNPAPAAQCNRTLDGWGDRMRQVVDDSKNPLWNPDFHVKVVDLQADIAILVKDGATGGIRFRLDYWDESYNDQNEAPTTTDPALGYYVTNWVEYTSAQEIYFTTMNPFPQVVLPIQRLGLTLASASAAAAMLALGLTFLAVAGLLVLAEWVTYPGALAIIGGVYVLAYIVFLVIKVRSIKK